MNTHIFERKSFLEGSWIKPNKEDFFSTEEFNSHIVVRINLLRATANEADLFKNYLRRFHSQNPNQIIFDLSKSTFIDSTFLSTIITFSNKNTLKLKLIISDPKQLAIFKLTKIDSLFQIFPDLEKAMLS